MARTKASVGAKVSSGKSSKARCAVPTPSTSGTSAGSSSSKAGYSGGNPVCPRETPKWQKPITTFFVCKDKRDYSSDSEAEDGIFATTSKSKKNVIHSDEELSPDPKHNNDVQTDEEIPNEQPKNRVLDESIPLEPLDGEDSHKIEEYYPKNGVKGKGKGKKTKDKENMDNNVKTRKSVKRDFGDVPLDEDNERVSKKAKAN